MLVPGAVEASLEHSPDFMIDWLSAGKLGDHISGEMKSGVFRDKTAPSLELDIQLFH